MNNLCISLEIGPKCPNPEAMVLISTCFQQQYGLSSRSSVQHDSSIKSDLNNPNDNDCHECIFVCEIQSILVVLNFFLEKLYQNRIFLKKEALNLCY